MTSSFFFLQAEKNPTNHKFLEDLEIYCAQNKLQAYVIDKPLGDNKYAYAHKHALVVLIPKHKILFVDFSQNQGDFDAFIDDFIEDLGSISDKYRYRDVIGRPRSWKDDLLRPIRIHANVVQPIETLLDSIQIVDPARQRVCELLISLLTGSINDVEKVKGTMPENLLDKIKQKILLFDGDQTRFVYEHRDKTPIRIQGLSGTGKTELLLHKLKEIYLNSGDSRIAFTCHNKILADSLRQRIPDFFNFMKVEQQIKWHERLWCMHAWGSGRDKNSGTYRYICDFFDLPFFSWGPSMPFDRVCAEALKILKAKERAYAFDYLLNDESQDFPESFFELCSYVTANTVYIAGDIFQSIFDETITASISPDYLLSKCYRTDPRTLMFAHSLGMGLFEKTKLRWLKDAECKSCGYIVEKDSAHAQYRLTREPLRRFEDVDRTNVPSVEITAVSGPFYRNAAATVIEIIRGIQRDNPTVTC